MLEFCAIESTFAQPRNAIIGQLLGSIIGVACSKGFAHSASFQSQNLQWLAGTLSCGCTIVAMSLTGTVHPPAGATALLAVTDDSVSLLGWTLVPLVMLSCALMLVVALIINNVQRRFPLHWWTPEEVGAFWRRAKHTDIEEAKTEAGSETEPDQSSASVDGDLGQSVPTADHTAVTVTSRGVFIPPAVRLTSEELLLLEGLCQRL